MTTIGHLRETSKNNWLKLALLFFILSATMGLWMRAMAVYEISGSYAFIRQGHSHVAFLGWAYLALITLLVETFLPKDSLKRKRYKWNLSLTSIFITSMMFSFPFLGYKTFSIVLLTLFLITSCVFVYHFLKDYRQTKPKGITRLFVNTAFFFYLLSGIGPFALGPIVVMIGKGAIYHLAVYYYLHFLYNGFFIFAIFALIFKHLAPIIEQKKTLNTVLKKSSLGFFRLTLIACVPAYALSALWLQPPAWVYIIGIIAAVMQVLSIAYFWPMLKLLKMSVWPKRLLLLSLFSYFIKMLLQFLSSASWIADKVYEAKSYVVVGYIHLVTIGFISLFILAWSMHKGYFSVKSTGSKIGLSLFLTGFVSSELLLFSKGLMQWISAGGFENFHFLLFAASILMPTGLILFGVYQRKSV